MTFQVTIASEKIKENIEVYEEGNNKQLLRTVRDFKNFVDTYDLFTELNETSVYAKFYRVLKGYTKDKWDELIHGETIIEVNFDTHLANLVTDELGTEAFKYQVKYPRKTKNLGNLTLKIWMKRVRSLNRYLLLLKAGEQKTYRRILTEEFILETIPARWQRECDLRDIDETSNWSEVQVFLMKSEEYLGETQTSLTDRNSSSSVNSDPRIQTKGTEKSKGKDVDEKKVNNPCNYPNHQSHEWSDYLNNPHSKKFKGIAKTLKDFPSMSESNTD